MFLAFLLTTGKSFYLPGIAPIDYEKGGPLEVKVNLLENSVCRI